MRCSMRPPVAEIKRLALQVQFLDDQLVELILHEAQRHFVDAEFLVAFLDDRPRLHIAEQRDLVRIVLAPSPLGSANEDIGLNTDLPQAGRRSAASASSWFRRRLSDTESASGECTGSFACRRRARIGGWLPETASLRYRRRCRRFR